MATLDRYILRQLTGALVIVLATFTTVGWLTQAIRLLELVVEKGRSVLEFLGLTLLMVPLVAALVAPTALFVACVYVLHRLNSDSELVVIHVAGLSPWRLLRPFMLIGAVVAVLVMIVNLYALPLGMRAFNEKITALRADIISTFIQKGQFQSPNSGLMVHIKDQTPTGELVGLIVDDARDPEAPITYLAKRARLISEGDQAFLLLTDGNVLRSRADLRSVDLVRFEQYMLNLSDYARDSKVGFLKPPQMFISELLNPDPNDPYAKTFPLSLRAEAHDRLSNPLYALAVVLIAFAGLSEPRSTRRNQVVAIVAATGVATIVRVAGMISVSLAGNSAMFVPATYAVPLVTLAAATVLLVVRAARGSARGRQSARDRSPLYQGALPRSP